MTSAGGGSAGFSKGSEQGAMDEGAALADGLEAVLRRMSAVMGRTERDCSEPGFEEMTPLAMEGKTLTGWPMNLTVQR